MTKLSMQFNLLIYVLIAFFTFSMATLSSDEAAKYITPFWLFVLKYIFGACNVIVVAIKMFCSTTFSDYMAKAKADATGNTQFVNKSTT